MSRIGYLFLLAFILVSCKKENNGSSGFTVTGKNKLVVTVVHHTYNVAGITVYLKEKATDFPGTDTAVYDWSSTSDLSGVAVFENLFEGTYFLYAKGLDNWIGQEVVGAAPVILNSATLSNNEAYVTVFVTE